MHPAPGGDSGQDAAGPGRGGAGRAAGRGGAGRRSVGVVGPLVHPSDVGAGPDTPYPAARRRRQAVAAMTAPTSTPSPADARPAAACDVCAHPAAAHDVIGQRFCDATVRGGLTRGCICRPS